MTRNPKQYINQLASNHIPFLFIIDYKGIQPMVIPLSQISNNDLLYSINGLSNSEPSINFDKEKNSPLKKHPISFLDYQKQFDQIMFHLTRGDSYLTNLTCETPIDCKLSLKDIFYLSQAQYRIWFNNEWVVFSPESFVKISDGKIVSFPMKGTIDASIDNAELKILEDRKESAEHATIVDLIRNDLSRVATKVTVDKYRYVDKIKTNQGALLQVSSQISGTLPANYLEMLGDLLFDLLPAGSISGAPKEKTVSIIDETETYHRGYYTGICGIFDGKDLDSGVMIRFIEHRNQKLYFKSGGGITVNSNVLDEYNEMIQKVYLPF